MCIRDRYGEGKNLFVAEVNRLVRERMKPVGINIDYIAIVGNVWLPQNVKAAIDEKVKAGQLAAQRETEVATARAEADKAVATAEGEARSKKAIAEANACDSCRSKSTGRGEQDTCKVSDT